MTAELILIITSLFAGVVCIVSSLVLLRQQKKINEMLVDRMAEAAFESARKYKEVNSTLASVRVKHGQTWENFMPLMVDFEKQLGPKENATFLGQPIDLIYFNDNEVVFVEVKTGNSQLSQKQRHIRKLVLDKKVRWAEVNDAFTLRPNVTPNHKLLKIVEHRK